MLTLGIESSCDETSVAVVKNKSTILSNIVASQEIHASFGGVVPELASRAHIKTFPSVFLKSLKESNISPKQLDLIAVSTEPGLIGSLSVGIQFAQGLSDALKKPLVGVNHVEAHIYSAYISQPEKILFPALGVVISGAHTALFLMESPTTFKLIGKTRDDAIGETFDKVASILELPYPGGPSIEKLAKEGNPQAYQFSEGKVPGYEFSFSGLKTAVMYAAKGNNTNKKTPNKPLTPQQRKDLAASFQRAAFASLARKIPLAAQTWKCKSILLGGGVSNNKYFQNLLNSLMDIPVFFPLKELCSDNAAMIALLGSAIYSTIGNEQHSNLKPCTRSSWEPAFP
ncbi:tRNA (adenosine(37)-N6)-threonylcarbamoyltransferase complex transferase subunit TsaD [Chlamydiifrater phoenicopteri]|uniref:tRNA (adenosine(37)-N6)-threonylcarbamoyltransferase complex transferase subunit TsaD n=1 Tax=Chlamydiifrater phoenicopteri TaxID=2681469 RepID=UPI001BCD2574|nr:tRNA (adenosine(37)-N6)-threonylcarbamoyltransferase complex transferase subunit TsaD [Chlamydiifrater phoenicopteri]